jgi:hypothetical protein
MHFLHFWGKGINQKWEVSLCPVDKTMVTDLTIHCLLDGEIFLINTNLF